MVCGIVGVVDDRAESDDVGAFGSGIRTVNFPFSS